MLVVQYVVVHTIQDLCFSVMVSLIRDPYLQVFMLNVDESSTFFLLIYFLLKQNQVNSPLQFNDQIPTLSNGYFN